ncbi:MAG: DedA family protein [Deltaproteobacteria bacterium]|nr:DedA family protein [Deltaproteobacteria bacterium]
MAFFLGRPFFERYGKYVLVTEDKIRRSEEFFEKYGAMATFICRFITVIRQLVSLPAGFSKMDIKKFVIYTALGSTLWSAILAYLGYAFGAGEEMIRQYKGPITKGAILAAVVVTVIYAATVIRRKRNASLTS